MKIEKTINETAVYLYILEGEDKDDLHNIINFATLEKNAIILDFSKTTSINSSFIAGIVKVYEECVEKNIKFVIHDMNELVTNIFDCVGITKVLKNCIAN
jgi:anti-anti-sigma regulatory factor